MMEWLDFGIQLHGSWLYVLLVPAAIAFALGVYRHTQPRATRRLRIILPALRSVSIVLLLLLLAEPVLTLLLKRTVPPTIITLLDTSTSMAVGDTVSRLQQARRIIDGAEFKGLKSVSMMETWIFADAPSRADFDTLSRIAPTGNATDIGAAIRAAISSNVTENNLSALLLLSDGAHNYGADPLHLVDGLTVPVYAVGFGSAADLMTDVQIVDARIEVPGIAGQPLSIRVALRGWGFEGRRTVVRLLEGETELASTSIQLEGAGENQVVSLETIADEPGPHIYRIEIDPLEGEISRENNQTLLATQIARGGISVVVVAGAPGAEYGFFRRSLASDSTLAIDEFIQRAPGTFYDREPAQLLAALSSRPDVIALVDAGPEIVAGEIAAAIDASVRAGSGLLFVGGARSLDDWTPQGPLVGILPFNASKGSKLTVDAVGLRIAQTGVGHPLMRTELMATAFDRGFVGREEDLWSRLPPVTGYLPGVRVRSGAIVLIEGFGPKGPAPVIMSSGPAANARVVAALSSQFWRLDLLSSGAGESPHTIRRFWRNTLRWLAIDQPSGRVRASTDRRVYREGEPVAFLVQVFDELMKPHTEALVSIQLDGNRIDLEPGDPGQYLGSRSGLDPGEYTYSAQAQSSTGKQLGESPGQFVVEEYSLESSDMRATPQLLDQMAAATGGSFQHADSWPTLIDEMDIHTRLQREERTMELWGRDWYILTLVLLLCVEWALRKRQGML